MIAKTRCHKVAVTSHEKLLLVFYRSLPDEQRRDVDGLLALWWRTLPDMGVRWRNESRRLGVGTLLASDVSTFVDASLDVLGVSRRLW